MPQKRSKQAARTEQGRQLARRLYDLKIGQLESLSGKEQARLLNEFPLLRKAEFQDVLRQVIEAKRYEQERTGWQAIPHDITVLVMVGVTSLLDLRSGAVAGVATLVLLESLFQFYFNRRLYGLLSTLVWLTYPAYVLLAYVLYRRGFEIVWIVMAVLLAWLGTFLLGMLARMPVRIILEARVKGSQEAARIKQERARKTGK
ncbi:MAG TPA: hypothetical protein VMY98_03165 [Anaerolineae bacterium]|nr:hypothetical protein [Anaerolineae bacterium]